MGGRSGYVYVIQDGSGLCKIGRTQDVQKRIQSLSTGSSSELTLVVAWSCDDAGEREAALHAEWKEQHVRGEWFRIPDHVLTGWRSENELVLATRGQPNRVATRKAPKSIWQPMPEEDGLWWLARGGQEIECPRCGEEYEDNPGVMFYIAVKDWGDLMRKTRPEWPRDGWAIWREHDRCGWHDWRSETATTRQIRSWGVGPWRSLYSNDD